MRRLRLQRARQQVGRVRLEHQAVLPGCAAPLRAAPRPRRSSQIQPVTPIESPSARHSSSIRGPLGEAMQHRARRGARVGAQHREEVGVRVALVQEERLVQPRGEAELELERPALVGGRREIPEVVEPAFARGDDHRVARASSASRAGVGVAESTPRGADARRRSRAGSPGGAGRARWPSPCRRASSRSRPSPRRQRRAPARARPRGPRRSCRARGWRRCRRARGGHRLGAAQAARSAVVTGRRAARSAGRKPPTMPIATAMIEAVDDERGRDREAGTRPA